MVGDEHSTSERTLSLREYKALLKTRDPGRLKIKKTRRAFLWRDEYYMLDTFHSPESASGADSASSLNLNFARNRKEEYPRPPLLERTRGDGVVPRAGTTTLFVEAPKGEFSFPPFLEAKVDVTTKHWFSSSAHDSYARTMMLAGEVASDPFDGDANADPRRGAW